MLLVLVTVLSGCKATETAAPVTTASSAVTTTSSTPTGVAIPKDLVGKTLAEARKELAALGFTDLEVKSVDGRVVIIESNWHVVTVEGAGTSTATSTKIKIGVDKTAPTTAQPTQHTSMPEPPPVTAAPQPNPPAPREVYYKDCAAAKAAGVAPLHRGEPGYRTGLDRDGDGIACER